MILVAAREAPKFLSIQTAPVAGLVTSTTVVATLLLKVQVDEVPKV